MASLMYYQPEATRTDMGRENSDFFFLKASRSTFETEQNIPMLVLRSIVRFFFNFVLRICKEIARFGDAQQK